MKQIKMLLLTAWTFPQQLVGLIVYIVCRIRKCYWVERIDRRFVFWNLTSGLSLGWFIFVNEEATKNTFDHEYGHTIQSIILGPLYLLVIGLPSIIWAGCFGKYRKKHHKSYYSFYTEKWADKLGGVER